MYPAQILEAVAEAYASCWTYRDSGQVKTRFHSQEGRNLRTSVKPFTTAFHRPDRFRFEYQHRYKAEHEWSRYIVWAHGETVRTWWDVGPRFEQPESLGLALAGATGVSGGLAHTVPALLMPDRVSGRRLTDLAELASLPDEALGEVSCYRVSGRFLPHRVDLTEDERHVQQAIALTGRRPERAEHSSLTVWIDRATLLIRRIEAGKQFETFRTDSVKDYTPAVGVPRTSACTGPRVRRQRRSGPRHRPRPLRQVAISANNARAVTPAPNSRAVARMSPAWARP